MAYNDFDLKTVTRPSDWKIATRICSPKSSRSSRIPTWSNGWTNSPPVALGMNTEKARSESIIWPILAEAKRRAGPPANVLSGVAFDVDRASGLSGFCDFLISRSDELYYVRAPIVAVVEAKKEDLINGIGQCAAEMVAISLFNERELSPIPVVHGCVTSGTNWKFLKLEGSTLSIDTSEYYLRDLAKILGILVSVIRG